MQCRCFDIGIAGAPTDGKLFTAQEAQAYYSAVDAVLLDSYAIAGCVIDAADMAQAQFGLRFYEPACVQVLSVAVFGADAVSPGIVIGFGSDVFFKLFYFSLAFLSFLDFLERKSAKNFQRC